MKIITKLNSEEVEAIKAEIKHHSNHIKTVRQWVENTVNYALEVVLSQKDGADPYE